MRLYLDQMFHQQLAHNLKACGHDVLNATDTGHQTADDSEILEFAIEDDRILITLDEHFGDWAVLPLTKHPGVIRIKVDPTMTENISKLLVPLLDRYAATDFRDRLVIVSRSSQRWINTSR